VVWVTNGNMSWALTSLGDHLPHPTTGERISQPDRHRQLIDLAVEAERLGARSIHLGEHHFCDYIVSAPLVLLTAMAMRTLDLRLSTAVTLAAHHDPVLLAEQWATLDVVSAGRAEMIVGRGVVSGLYDQFGQDYGTSREITAERVDLMKQLWTEENVSWSGAHRSPLTDITLQPRPVQPGGPPVWISVSSDDSIAEAVRLGAPAAIPLVSVGLDEGASLSHRYREAWDAAGRDSADALVAINVHCHVSTRPDARAYWAPFQLDYLRWVVTLVTGRAIPLEQLRPFWASIDAPDSQAICGSPEEVADRLGVFADAAGGVDIWLFQGDQGGLPEAEVTESMTLFADEVMPILR
jgi:alkanesulfonate monooxygenase SsuD/methylene tetrahydromethanopterin reductase-like flavin-dependent oxidoreductase (luciferase family)